MQFDILVFLETQEMNLRGNLRDIKCDILHVFMRIACIYEKFFSFKKRFIPPIELVVFFKTFVIQAPVSFCETDPFFLTLQPCRRDFLILANTDFKKNVSF